MWEQIYCRQRAPTETVIKFLKLLFKVYDYNHIVLGYTHLLTSTHFQTCHQTYAVLHRHRNTIFRRRTSDWCRRQFTGKEKNKTKQTHTHTPKAAVAKLAFRYFESARMVWLQDKLVLGLYHPVNRKGTPQAAQCETKARTSSATFVQTATPSCSLEKKKNW